MPGELSEEWRAIPLDIGSSTRHFALSDMLARTVTVPTVWWHATETPTLIVGPAQRLYAQPDASAAVERVRRQAGGGAVLADKGVVGLDVALPAGHSLILPDVVESYRWIGETWLGALEELGVEGKLVSVPEARLDQSRDYPLRPLVLAACFGSLSPYEVVIDGRKLVGLAQVRRRRNELLQAGIHMHFDAPGLAAELAPGQAQELAGELVRHALGLDDVATGIDVAGVMAAFERALQSRWGITLVPGVWTDVELARAGVSGS